MNKRIPHSIKQISEWLHATLILAIIIPLFCALGADLENTVSETLYFKCLVIAVPIILTDLAAGKCKSLVSYLIAGILIFAATGGLGFIFSGSLRRDVFFWMYMPLLLFETTFVIIYRLIDRLHEKRAEKAVKGEDPYWHPSYSVLREPAFPALIYFFAVYIFAVNLNSPAVCNAALFSAIVYAPVTFLHQYVDETENYLSLNKRTCNLPVKRIYGIGIGMLAFFLLLFIITILPALFTTSNRHYRDLRSWYDAIAFNPPEQTPEIDMMSEEEDPWAALIEEYGEPKPTPHWLILLSDIMEVAILLFFAVLLLKKIRDTFRDFYGVNDENGDIVEELEEIEEKPDRIMMPTRRRNLTERERIRRDYRKAIRRHRKDRPAIYESPIEIETRAGISDSEEGRELHRHYELARYGRER